MLPLVLPVKTVNDKLVVAMANPLEFYALDDLRFVTRKSIAIAVAPQSEIIDALYKYYPDRDLEKKLELDTELDGVIDFVENNAADQDTSHDLLSIADLPPVVRFTNRIFADAIKQKASDIHIEPHKEFVLLRFRIDGVMREIMQVNKQIHTSLVSRIKIISDMDISVRRQPQDGRANVKFGKNEYDLRISTIPTSYGEKVTIRLLNPDTSHVGIDKIGLSKKNISKIKNIISRPQGIIIVTGPTGSGKTSTLCAFLKKMNTPLVNIITVEDPIEYDIAGINQVQINPRAGITFASGLRSILRQDPDIILVGEIRDSETVEVAFQAAQTGHLVLSTLHTNDAPSAITRLIDLGIDRYVISDGLIAILSQRLVRKICPECKSPDPDVKQIFDTYLKNLDISIKDLNLWKGAGCEQCKYTGYSGRIGIFELFEISSSIEALIAKSASASEFSQVAMDAGYKPLFFDGLDKALKGITTIEEVLRVAPYNMSKDYKSIDGALDIEPANSNQFEASSNRAISPIKPKTALIADDDVDNRLISNILESNNYLTITVNDGQDVIRRANTDRPDIIIANDRLPDIDGTALLTKLKSSLDTQIIPIIMSCQDDNAESEITLFNSGADDVIFKPIIADRLIARVERRLEVMN